MNDDDDGELGIMEIIMETGCNPIEWRGLTVHSGYHPPAEDADLLEVRFVSFSRERRQALEVKLFGGWLDFGDGVKDTHSILWAHKWWPETVTADIRWGRKKDGRRIVTYNAWIFDDDDEDLVLSGMGSAGVLITPLEEGWVRLECSDGTHVSDADFTDLVVDIRVTSSNETG